MKLVLKLFLAFSFLLASTAFAASSSLRALESLHDLPAKWEGVGGGLLLRVPATFTINKILKVTHDDNNGVSAFLATYDVDATFTIGDRKLVVKQIVMTRYFDSDTRYEFVIHLDDDLAEAMFANVTYDEVTDSYRLQESIINGERRFSLSAPRTAKNLVQVSQAL